MVFLLRILASLYRGSNAQAEVWDLLFGFLPGYSRFSAQTSIHAKKRGDPMRLSNLGPNDPFPSHRRIWINYKLPQKNSNKLQTLVPQHLGSILKELGVVDNSSSPKVLADHYLYMCRQYSSTLLTADSLHRALTELQPMYDTLHYVSSLDLQTADGLTRAWKRVRADLVETSVLAPIRVDASRPDMAYELNRVLKKQIFGAILRYVHWPIMYQSMYRGPITVSVMLHPE